MGKQNLSGKVVGLAMKNKNTRIGLILHKRTHTCKFDRIGLPSIHQLCIRFVHILNLYLYIYKNITVNFGRDTCLVIPNTYHQGVDPTTNHHKWTQG